MDEYVWRMLPNMLRAIATERKDALAISALNHAAQALEQMHQDISRYQYLRDRDMWPCVFSDGDKPGPLRGVELDAVIDTCIQDAFRIVEDRV